MAEFISRFVLKQKILIMTDITNNTNRLFDKVSDLLKAAQNKVLQTVNTTMVATYFEIGRMIVEEEQLGKERAKYGDQLITELSKKLSSDFGKGFSATNIKQMRSFTFPTQKVRHCLTNSN